MAKTFFTKMGETIDAAAGKAEATVTTNVKEIKGRVKDAFAEQLSKLNPEAVERLGEVNEFGRIVEFLVRSGRFPVYPIAHLPTGLLYKPSVLPGNEGNDHYAYVRGNGLNRELVASNVISLASTEQQEEQPGNFTIHNGEGLNSREERAKMLQVAMRQLLESITDTNPNPQMQGRLEVYVNISDIASAARGGSEIPLIDTTK